MVEWEIGGAAMRRWENLGRFWEGAWGGLARLDEA